MFKYVISLILLGVSLSASFTSTLAAPARQSEEVRNFDARIVRDSRGSLAAQDCRTGQVLRFTDIERFPNPPQMNRYYHFEKARIWEGDPGRFYILEIESPGFRYWEIAPCGSNPANPPVPAPVGVPERINFSLDKEWISPGQCVTVQWDVDGVRAVYLNGRGVVGHDKLTECGITSSRTYTLRVITTRGEETRTATVYVLESNNRTQPPGLNLGASNTAGESAQMTAEARQYLSKVLTPEAFASFTEKVANVANASKCSLDVIEGLQNSAPMQITVPTPQGLVPMVVRVPMFPPDTAEDCYDQAGAMFDFLNNLIARPVE